MLNEDFFPIPGYENIYWISKDGRISNGKIILKTYTINSGYQCVKLSDSTHSKKAWLVHRLVALTFLENPNHLPEVNHKNGVKSDNQVKNLEWVTTKENKAHAKITKLWEYNRPSLGKHMSQVSKFHRVGWDKSRNKWIASIYFDGKTRNQKRFDCEIEAAKYADSLLDLYGISDRPRNF